MYYFEKNLMEAINFVEEDIDDIIDNGGTEDLLLVLLRKDDSLLNCLCKIKYEELKEYLYSSKLCSDNKNKYILEKAKSIAEKDNEENITDEHILYALLKDGDNNAIEILEIFGVNTNLMLITVDEYLELEDDDFLINLTQEVKSKKTNPFIGRNEYIDKIVRILFKKQKNNCMLIGKAGVGKSALVEGVAQRLISKEYDGNIYRLEIGSLIAGTRYRGDLEERIMNVINKIKEKKAILFIDEIHMVTASFKSDDSLSIGNILKPILSRDGIKCIGATTLEEYYEFIDRDKAFARRFQNIYIPEPSEDETFNILSKIKGIYENHYKCKYSKNIIKKIIDYSKMFPNRCFPDKAIDLLDEVGAYTLLNNKKINETIVKKITLENLGLGINHKIIKYDENDYITQMYKEFIDIKNNKKIIGVIEIQSEKKDSVTNVVKRINKVFGLDKPCEIEIDLEFFDEYMYAFLQNEVLKNPLCIVIINNYHNALYNNQRKIKNIIESGICYDAKGRIISFKNTIFIFQSNYEQNEVGYNKSKYVKKIDFIEKVIS